MKSVVKLIGTAVLGGVLAGSALAADPIKIALVHGTSGHAFEVFSKQAQTGFALGLEYATGGTFTQELQDPISAIYDVAYLHDCRQLTPSCRTRDYFLPK